MFDGISDFLISRVKLALDTRLVTVLNPYSLEAIRTGSKGELCLNVTSSVKAIVPTPYFLSNHIKLVSSSPSPVCRELYGEIVKP